MLFFGLKIPVESRIEHFFGPKKCRLGLRAQLFGLKKCPLGVKGELFGSKKNPFLNAESYIFPAQKVTSDLGIQTFSYKASSHHDCVIRYLRQSS
jgi:hypothetical protein